MVAIDRAKVNRDLERVCDIGLGLMEKKKLEADDFSKLKAMKAMSSYMNARVAMVQQETAQQRIELIKMRMVQLGFETEQKAIKGN